MSLSNYSFLITVFLGSLFLISCQKPTKACFDYSFQNNNEVVFDVSCSQNADIFYFDFGNGELDTLSLDETTLVHGFEVGRNYDVTLKVVNKCGTLMSPHSNKFSSTETIEIE